MKRGFIESKIVVIILLILLGIALFIIMKKVIGNVF